jgi:hypothetical protein
MLTQAGRIGSGYPSDLRLGLQFATGFETHLVLAMHRTNVAVWTGDKRNAGRRNDDPKQRSPMHLGSI